MTTKNIIQMEEIEVDSVLAAALALAETGLLQRNG